RIPTKFSRKYGQGMSNLAFLKLPSGAEWKVEMTEHDGEVWLKKGWQEFAKYYSVKQGHFLLFRYEGNSHFHVLIFDASATEIEYSLNSSHGEEGELNEEFRGPKMEEIESDSAVEILGWFPPCSKRRDKSPLPCLRPHKKMKTNPTAKGLKGISTTEQCSNSKVVRRIQPLNNSKIARALPRASAFKPKDPYFMVVMQPSYLHPKLCLSIPIDFASRYLNKKHGDAILCISDGRKWPVKYTCQMFATKPKFFFKCGWRTFAKDNNLEVGDVCVFGLSEGTKMSFKVVIFRVSEEHCLPLPVPALDNEVNQVEPKRTLKYELEYPSNHKIGMSSSGYKSTTKHLQHSQGDFTTEPQGTQSIDRKISKLKRNLNSPSSMRSFEGQITKLGSGGLNFSAKEEGRGMPDSPRCPESHGFRETQGLTYIEKARALKRACAFKSENPYFMIVLQPSYIYGNNNLVIPLDFAKKHFSEKHEDVILQASGSKIWSVKYNFREAYGRQKAELCSGWKAFVRDNNLEVGDVCVFEFIKGIEISLKVVIFRDAEDANRRQDPGKFKQWIHKESISKHVTQKPSSSRALKDQLSAGWFAFARDNGLQIGDVCVFELIKSDKVVLKVFIFRGLS
ncbi:b3 domain-containing transcription factor vrn1, partial [Quercus suber]